MKNENETSQSKKEETEVIEETPDKDTASDYIETIKNLKANSVPKKDYDKVVAERKELLKAMEQGRSLPEEDKKPQGPTLEEANKKLFVDTPSTNMEVVQASLDQRKACIDAGLPDPYLPKIKDGEPSQHDYDTAEKVAKVFQECLDEAEGNPETFQIALNRRIVGKK